MGFLENMNGFLLYDSVGLLAARKTSAPNSLLPRRMGGSAALLAFLTGKRRRSARSAQGGLAVFAD